MGINRKVIGLMKDKLDGTVTTQFMALRPKLYAYKMLSESGGKKMQESKKVHCEEVARLRELQAVLISRLERV